MKHACALARQLAVPASAIAGLIIFALTVHPLYPIQTWLFWRYLGYWSLVLVWTAACLSTGDAVIRRLAPSLPLAERLLFAFAAGLLVFVTLVFAGGVLRLYSPVFFFMLPCLMILVGGRPFLGFVRRVARRGALIVLPKRTTMSWLVTLFGLGGLGLVYFGVLSPENLAADALWYHLTIPERNAAMGGILRYPEGWYMGTLPQLASLIYTWAFLLPKSEMLDRVALASHLEFAVLMWTLFGIPVLVRWALGPARTALGLRASSTGAWAALFLFPGIFLYDSSLGVAADHVAAFWAVPILLALRRAWRTPTPRLAVLFAIPVAGALLTKYQSAALVALPIAALGVRLAWLALGPGRSRTARLHAGATALTCLGAGLGLTAIHWLKNWVWYGDPFYPHLYRYLTLRPWSEDAEHMFRYWFLPTQTWTPTGTLGEKLLETCKVLFTFSFIPNNYPVFSGKLPVFGSLFTLSLLPLVFLTKARRVWVVVAATMSGIAVWYWISHVDRYLQALTPWMAVVVAAVVVLVWAGGRLNRAALALLVAFQIVWGGDIPFFPNFGNHGAPAALRTINLLSTGRRGDFAIYRNPFPGAKIAALLPPNATLLLHDMNGALGLERPFVSDIAPWQAAFRYGHMTSPRELQETLRGMGVTHLCWRPDSMTGLDTLAGDLLFYAFAAYYVGETKVNEGYYVAPLSADPPPRHRWLEWPVANFACSEGYAQGLYQLGDLSAPIAGPRQPASPRTPADAKTDIMAMVSASRFVVLEPSCAMNLVMTPQLGFAKVAVRRGAELWVRTAPPPSQ